MNNETTQYYINWIGKMTGPFSAKEINDLIADGSLKKFHQLSTDRLHWQAAEEWEAFKDVFMIPVVPVAMPSQPMPPVPEGMSAEAERADTWTKPVESPQAPPIGRQARPAEEIRYRSVDQVMQSGGIDAPVMAFGLPSKTSGLAVASLVLGLVSVTIGWLCCGWVCGVLAIIFGHIAQSNINDAPKSLKGKGMAIAGYILGYVGLVFSMIISFIFGLFTALPFLPKFGLFNALPFLPK